MKNILCYVVSSKYHKNIEVVVSIQIQKICQKLKERISKLRSYQYCENILKNNGHNQAPKKP